MHTRKNGWYQTWQYYWRRLTATPVVVWDIGAVTTRVHIGQKLVFSQASCLAVNQEKQQMVAFGDSAYRLLGNTGPHLSIFFPVDRGCLTDTTSGVSWLQYIRMQLWPRRRWLTGLRSPKGLLSLGEGVGQADISIWKSTLETAGLSAVRPASGLVGLSWYLNLATADEPCFVLDMGGSQTQIGVLVRGSVLRSKTIGWGGIDVTTAVQTWLVKNYHCQVSWRIAEQLKCTHGSVSPTKLGTKKAAVKGKDPYTQLGITATVELAQLQTMLIDVQQDLLLFIRQFLASVPAEIATQCLENGIWLAGGAAKIDGIERWLSVSLGTPVTVVNDPHTAMSKGVAICAASKAAQG